MIASIVVLFIGIVFVAVGQAFVFKGSNMRRLLGRSTAKMATTQSVSKCPKLAEPAGLLDSTDIFIFDCDGVIWRGDSLIDGIPSVLEKLRKLGKRMFFVTNNSTKSRKGYKAKFTKLGLDVQDEEIFSSR